MPDEIPRELVKLLERAIVKQTNEFISKLNLTPEEGSFVRMQLNQLQRIDPRDEWSQWRKKYGSSFRSVALPAAFAIMTQTYELIAKVLDGEVKLD